MNETKNQNPLWADEPTPLCDGELNAIDPAKEDLVIDPDFARDLERRLRYALKLVNSLRIDIQTDNFGYLDPDLVEQRFSGIEEVLQG